MDVIPKFAEWAKEGENGNVSLHKSPVTVQLFLGLVQGFGTAIGFNRHYQYDMIPGATFTDYLMIAIILTAGTAFLMWLGEQITEKGIGNGISVLIFAGIVAGYSRTAFAPSIRLNSVDAGDAAIPEHH